MQSSAAITHNRSTITTAFSKNENSEILQSLKEKLNQTENVPIPGKIILLKKWCLRLKEGSFWIHLKSQTL